MDKRKEIESKIETEMIYLHKVSAEIKAFMEEGTPLSEESMRYIAWAVLPTRDMFEQGKALRLRLRLFTSVRFSVLPDWVQQYLPGPPPGIDRRIVERLRADLFRFVSFVDLRSAEKL